MVRGFRFSIRPNAVGAAISRPNPAAPPPSLVGRHAHMPPWPGRDAREPGASGGAVRAHIQCAPTTRRVAGASVGADFISARTGPQFPPHPAKRTRLLARRWGGRGYRMKLVRAPDSAAGASMPAALPASMHWRSQAIFRPRLRMTCMPSRSCLASSAQPPWTMGQ